MPDHQDFGAALRRARIEAGLSLADMAKQVNHSRGYLSKIENGVSTPSVQMARRCASVLAVGADLAALVPAKPARKAAGGGPVLPIGTEAGSACAPLVGRFGELSPELEPRYVQIFQRLRELGRRAQPAVVLPMLGTQVAVLRRYIETADEPRRRQASPASRPG